MLRDDWDTFDCIVEPVGTDQSAPNAIVELPLKVSGVDAGLYPDETTDVPPTLLGDIADILAEQNVNTLSAEVDIQRQAAVEQIEAGVAVPTVRFTVETLTDVATMLTVAITEARHRGDDGVMNRIGQFGQLVAANADAPMNADTQLELAGIYPVDGHGSYVDPFKVIAREQECELVL